VAGRYGVIPQSANKYKGRAVVHLAQPLQRGLVEPHSRIRSTSLSVISSFVRS
jgi:hypothetical protein